MTKWFVEERTHRDSTSARPAEECPVFEIFEITADGGYGSLQRYTETLDGDGTGGLKGLQDDLLPIHEAAGFFLHRMSISETKLSHNGVASHYDDSY